jgi:type II secretory pathway component PulK
MVVVVLGVVVAQMRTRTTVADLRIQVRLRERQLRRALDSVPGLASRMLWEDSADLRVDALDDEWARPKAFDIGDVRVEITIQDDARKFDLKGLLEEEPEKLEDNKRRFIDFAVSCGVANDVAALLADAIAQEAEARRLEDAVELEEPTAPAEGDGQAQEPPPAAQPATAAMVPLWLEDFLALPQLSDDDRAAIRRAFIIREDPLTLEQSTVRFLDQITIWRHKKANINTAGRQVLLAELPEMARLPELVDAILVQRAEEHFNNTAQIRNVVELTKEEARDVARSVQLNSRRFRVTATARLRQGKAPPGLRPGRMVLVLERRGQAFTTLWRRTNI